MGLVHCVHGHWISYFIHSAISNINYYGFARLHLNTVRMHIALKRQGMLGGLKDLYKSMSSSLGGSRNNSGGMGYSSTKFYCMNCEFEHKENTCPKCGSKAVKVG
ncbi:MAG: hypothetical protein ACJ71F_11235 [Nitrososphaeraceae archaeon]